MSFSENYPDSEWNEPNRKNVINAVKGEKKNYHFFRDHWLDHYKPWLSRSTDTPTKPYCNACCQTLSCRKYDLDKHGRTIKHNIMLATYLRQNGFPPIPLSHQNVNQRKPRKKRRTAQETQEVDSNFESVFIKSELEEEEESNAEDEENNGSDLNIPTATKSQNKLDSVSIYSDTSEPATEMDHLDFFFESVGASLKALSPKLTAEAKMRISELICELELREIESNPPTAVNIDDSQTPADGEEHLHDEHEIDNPNEEISVKRKIPQNRDDLYTFGKRRKVMNWRQALPKNSPFNELQTKASIYREKKDHIDSFCDSVCLSVKALPPNIVAKAKLLIARLIGELELREINEMNYSPTASHISEFNNSSQDISKYIRR